ncbi:putative RNA binding protein YcfA (HicA-like mRNA interferase family) [Desulfofundulus luciae]|uniref:RNA binding protein YcfA (HicA-like mRNA interferase family) n=1 Tax=Desulfofundulus luciae TaxID=74702 RepID=A0ABU0AXJ0_9FIRM|nr:type II toxin-antitoxin system HicA family toxin [Desulfofundulus luciae]MDQ0285200.1 putative RNA binding protein YcfA (HicA-like mRNA interferase family) [Desulfofundulus luciae]
MAKLPILKAREVIAALQKLGFEIDHVTGSHYILRHPDGRRAVVPYHGNRDIKQGVLRSILRQAGLTVDELKNLIS